MPPLFPTEPTAAEHFSRSDVMNELGTFARHSFFLDECEWPSVEHYYQAMKFVNQDYREKVRQAEHPRRARKLGRNRFQKRRGDWHQVKATVMTRAVYTKCRAHPEVAAALLATGDKTLVENSNYDYYWGCGRDRRGANMYGKVLMNVRDKLREEQAAAD